jgi:hypothetical protein
LDCTYDHSDKKARTRKPTWQVILKKTRPLRKVHTAFTQTRATQTATTTLKTQNTQRSLLYGSPPRLLLHLILINTIIQQYGSSRFGSCGICQGWRSKCKAVRYVEATMPRVLPFILLLTALHSHPSFAFAFLIAYNSKTCFKTCYQCTCKFLIINTLFYV